MYKIVFFEEIEKEIIIMNTWTGFSTYADARYCIADFDQIIPLEWEWEIMKE